MMTTAKLVTIRTPKPNKHTSTKRQSKRAQRNQRDTDRIMYCDTFNMINSTLAKHGILSKTLKQSSPAIFTIKRPHITLPQNINRKY